MTDRTNGADPHGDDLRFIADLRAALAATALADTIAAPSPADQLLEMIVRVAARAIPSPEGALMLIDHEREALTFEVVIGSTAATVRNLTVPLGHGIAGLVAVSGQALAVANAGEDPRHARDIAEKSGYLPTTILAVPVVARDGTPVGVLELLDRQGQETFDLDDMDLLSAFADQLALVLEMRRTHEMLGARVGAVIASLGDLPSGAATALVERVGALVERVETDVSSRRANELAALVVAISRSGQDEHEACTRVLRAFVDYLNARPSPGSGVFA
jgi:signal transduction protein with GAF and PtsI domain